MCVRRISPKTCFTLGLEYLGQWAYLQLLKGLISDFVHKGTLNSANFVETYFLSAEGGIFYYCDNSSYAGNNGSLHFYNSLLPQGVIKNIQNKIPAGFCQIFN